MKPSVRFLPTKDIQGNFSEPYNESFLFFTDDLLDWHGVEENHIVSVAKLFTLNYTFAFLFLTFIPFFMPLCMCFTSFSSCFLSFPPLSHPAP